MALDLVSAKAIAQTIKDHAVSRMVLFPKHWREYSNSTSLTWRLVHFTKSNARMVPLDTGVYSFLARPKIAGHDAIGYLLYIGKASGKKGLRARYRRYLNPAVWWKDRAHVADMISRWDGHLWFYYATIANPASIKQVEDDLLVAFLPPYNHEFPARVSAQVRMAFG